VELFSHSSGRASISIAAQLVLSALERERNTPEARGMKQLLIDLPTLPEEGKSFAGELTSDLFDLPAYDAQPTGPLVYEVYVQRFESELLLSGKLSAPFEFTCVRTLHPFIQTISVEHADMAIEIGNESVIDAAEALREEILIHFPADPRCDDADVPMHCEIDPRYLAVDKDAEGGVETPPRDGTDDRWSALDALDQLDSER
jgi:uncharacterized protein